MSRVVAVLSVAAAIALAPGHASAQAIKVFDFSCTSGNTSGVNIDIRGLGNTNLCVVSTVNESLDCACVGGGGNCTSDTKKQETNTTVTSATLEQPQNGRVNTTVNAPSSPPTSSQCQLSCPSGQTATLIQFEVTSAQYTVCTLAANQACTPTACNSGNTLATANCGPAGEVLYPGKHNSCSNLFQ